MNTTKGSLYNFGTHKDTEKRDVNEVFGTDLLPGPVTGPGAGKPVMIGEAWYTGNGTANSNIVEEFAEDGGYTKLREISVAYAMDNAAVRRMGLSSIDIRARRPEPAYLDRNTAASIRRPTSRARRRSCRATTSSTCRRRDRS